MIPLSPKIKIYIFLAAWFVATGVLFGYVFPRFDEKNNQVVAGFADDRKVLDKLKAEKESYRLARKDLAEVESRHIQPDAFFSQDITLVREIQTLENLFAKYQVKGDLSGLAGTLQTAQKAQTASPVVIVPYSLGIQGEFPRVMAFIENLEHVPFVTTVNSVSVSASDKSQVNVSLTAYFYLRKN